MVMSTDGLSQDPADRYIMQKNAVLVGNTTNVKAICAAYAYTADGEWVAPFRIEFDSNGGDAVASVPLLSGATVYPALPTPSKDGAAFVGWKYGDTTVNPGDALLVGETHTLVAEWRIGLSINLDPNGATIPVGQEVGSATMKEDGKYYYDTLPELTREGYTFGGWYYGDNKVTSGAEVVDAKNHTLVAKWTINSYTIKVTTSNATVKVNGVEVANNSSVSIVYGTQVNVEVTYTKDDSRSTTITGADGTPYTNPFTMPGQDVTIKATSKNSCFTPDTRVTLADGTQKRIDEMEYTDMILVWNFYEGKYDVVSASILMNHGYDTVEVLTLVFADGTTVNTINGHGFFDEALNQFVIIDTENVADFVGHAFVKLDGDSYSTTELVGYSIETRYTEVWSILTAVHYNAIIEGMWSVTEAEVPNSPAYLMPFVVGEDMKYDSELMQADIEKYGLYTYEEFAMYCTKEQFAALGLEYFKVAVGKGYITYDQIIFLLELHCS
jgi:uncharacterized repeat protein (TIGR02543 family)